MDFAFTVLIGLTVQTHMGRLGRVLQELQRRADRVANNPKARCETAAKHKSGYQRSFLEPKAGDRFFSECMCHDFALVPFESGLFACLCGVFKGPCKVEHAWEFQ
eukprot:3565526-Amphidinium_carterae.1